MRHRHRQPGCNSPSGAERNMTMASYTSPKTSESTYCGSRSTSAERRIGRSSYSLEHDDTRHRLSSQSLSAQASRPPRYGIFACFGTRHLQFLRSAQMSQVCFSKNEEFSWVGPKGDAVGCEGEVVLPEVRCRAEGGPAGRVGLYVRRVRSGDSWPGQGHLAPQPARNPEVQPPSYLPGITLLLVGLLSAVTPSACIEERCLPAMADGIADYGLGGECASDDDCDGGFFCNQYNACAPCAPCAPLCTEAARECGPLPDVPGCDCGLCIEGFFCVEGQCSESCVPDCEGRECGPDDCGGICGDCGCEEICVDGQCEFIACNGKECGPDGCGGICGDCGCEEICVDGQCEFIACNGKECGPDGCGGTCGTCGNESSCVGGQCVPVCATICAQKECGEFGDCDCGTCPDSEVCELGACVDPCDEVCAGKECGGLAGCDCGQCALGSVCIPPGLCCTPNCEEKECGGDGCGGSCGECTGQDACVVGQCVCQPVCADKECGDDGCGGTCGYLCGPDEGCSSGVCYSKCYESPCPDGYGPFDGCHCPLPATEVDFEDEGDGTVEDHRTGLVWAKDVAEEVTFAQAVQYCVSLSESLPGQNWRLPTIMELAGVMDYATGSWTEHWHTSFGNSPCCWYWSSTPAQQDDPDPQHFEVDIRGPEIDTYPQSHTFNARCVRGEFGDVQTARFLSISNGVVLDRVTGLHWGGGVEPCSSNSCPCLYWEPYSEDPANDCEMYGCSWTGTMCVDPNAEGCHQSAAEAACSLKGPGWRVPSVLETMSLFNYSGVGSGEAPYEEWIVPGCYTWDCFLWTSSGSLVFYEDSGETDDGIWGGMGEIVDACGQVRCVKSPTPE